MKVDAAICYVLCNVWKPLHVLEGCNLHEERNNHYCFIKDGKSLIINVHKGECRISLVSANQSKKFINSIEKFGLLLLRENQLGDELVKAKVSTKGCTKGHKHKLDEIL